MLVQGIVLTRKTCWRLRLSYNILLPKRYPYQVRNTKARKFCMVDRLSQRVCREIALTAVSKKVFS